jgi:uncharacterized protein YndB with AHSA1/START domain
MANKGEAAAARPERNIVLTRIIDAPRELVFQAWTDPKQMARWWGPKCFINPVCEVDAKPGGALRIVMRAPDGAEYPMKGVFQEVVESERLVFTNIAVDQQGNHLLEGLTTVTFAEHEGKTKLTVQTGAVAMVGYASQYLEGMEAGWTQSLERLEELATNTAGREIVATRVYNAPRELVFRAWTEPQHLAQWWGPKGFTNTFHEFDMRPGGVWRFVMHGPDGTDYQNKNVFVEVVKPERIVFDHVTWPQHRVTATFEEVDGKTRLSFRMVFTSAADCDKVKGYAVEGLEQNLDRLEAELANLGDKRRMGTAESTDSTAAPAGRIVVVTRVFDAPAECVFDAWLDPNAAGKWLFAAENGQMVRVEIDARVGGRFVFVDRRDGEDIRHTGRYLAIDRPRRLVFTFGVPKYSPLYTRVTIDVAPHGSGCELTLTHEGVLPDYLEATKSGWTSILGGLAASLANNPTRK